MEKNTKLLKEVLSVPTKSFKEDLMIDFISKWLLENDFNYNIDSHKNIYVTKKTDDVDFFPCVVSHMDTVHNITSINIKERMLYNEQGVIKPALKAVDDKGNPTGIGGDDKCGVFACLTLLKELPNLKVAFFVSEEVGCIGSKNADKEFFKDVGYVIQFDAPGNTMVSEYSMGVQLFKRDSDFFTTCNTVLNEQFMNEPAYGKHPYTDVYALKSKFDFSCINFAIGYYDYHTKDEYVIIEDVFNGIETGKKMIEKLGYKKH
jgi:tripeptide aminopeptidase